MKSLLYINKKAFINLKAFKSRFGSYYTTPCASIASATFTKPAILAPLT